MLATFIYFLLLHGGVLLVVLGEVVNWGWLKNELKGPQWKVAVATVLENWTERPVHFFQGIDGKSWQRIIPLLSREKIAQIRGIEFQNNAVACQSFVEYLPGISNVESLPKIFRLTVYKFITVQQSSFSSRGAGSSAVATLSCANNWMENDGPEALALIQLGGHQVENKEPKEEKERKLRNVINSIPSGWIKTDGRLIMTSLVPSFGPSLLGLLNDEALATLLLNTRELCTLLTLNILRNLNPRQLSLTSPICMAAIDGLHKMNLSTIIANFPDNIFAKYNGPLSKETIESLSGNKLKNYGSQVDQNVPICTLLELQYLTISAISSITPRCLYGYLKSAQSKPLGHFWNNIPSEILKKFTQSMQPSWVNINPKDIITMPYYNLEIILSSPQVCTRLDYSILSKEMWKGMPAICVYTILTRSKELVKLGKIWKYIPYQTIRKFTDDMLIAVGNIYPPDFYHMRPAVIHFILKSRAAVAHLPYPTNDIILPASVRRIPFTLVQFSTLARKAPNVAGQLLMLMEPPPGDVLSGCEGGVIRSLTFNVPGQVPLGFSSLLGKLEETWDSFGQAIKLISLNSRNHFCATIGTVEEYLSFSWLRRNMSVACRSAIRFSVNDIWTVSTAPELADKNIPWQEMLEKWSLEDWSFFSANDRIAKILGQICKFWKVINDSRSDIMKVLNQNTLNNINTRCVAELGTLLRKNPRWVPLLGDEAFCGFYSKELPCDLKHLSAIQITGISRCSSAERLNPTNDKVKSQQHFLLKTTLEELKSLNHEQFRALLLFQWMFIPEQIKAFALNWHFQLVIQLLNSTIAKREGKGRVTYQLNFTSSNYELTEFQGVFESYVALRQANPTVSDNLNLAELILAVRDLPLRKVFSKLIRKFFPRPFIFAFARDASELRVFIHEAISDTSHYGRELLLPFTTKDGFDRAAILELLNSSPDDFASFDAAISNDDFIDDGGPIRILMDQALSDIERDLVELMPQSSMFRFVWAIDSKVGLLVGLFLGKALQLDVRLPFVLDPAFYKLLIDPRDVVIEKYYNLVYSKDIDEFESNIRSLRCPVTGSMRQVEFLLTRPEFLSFTKFSTKNDLDEAKNDVKAKSNIKGCLEGEGFDGIDDNTGEEFFDQYFGWLRKKVLDEFIGFVQEVFRGLGKTLKPVGKFLEVPPLALYPVAEFLPILLNAEPITGDDIVKRLKFIGDGQVDSLIAGEFLLASKIVTTFIRSLEGLLLKHLLAVLTGASTLSLRYSNIVVEFVHSPTVEPVNFDFCEADARLPDGKKTTMISPGKEYLDFFGKFLQNLSLNVPSIKPNCPPEGLPLIPISIMTCRNLITVTLQPAQQLFNSLVDMINTRLQDLGDSRDQAD